MQVFVNERSLNGQFSRHNVLAEIKTFLSAIAVLNTWEVKRNTFTSSTIYGLSPVPGIVITNVIKSNKELNDQFVNNMKSWSYWEESIEHDLAVAYTYAAFDYVNSSVAEIAQRKLNKRTTPFILVNFTKSIFGTSASINILKAPKTTVVIDCAYDEASITAILIAKNIINPAALYSTSSKTPPKDFQTVLIKSGSFVETALKNQHRKVYKRNGYNELWVVDNLHYGTEAHIEVFSSTTGKHLGISDINTIAIDKRYKDKDKTIDL